MTKPLAHTKRLNTAHVIVLRLVKAAMCQADPAK